MWPSRASLLVGQSSESSILHSFGKCRSSEVRLTDYIHIPFPNFVKDLLSDILDDNTRSLDSVDLPKVLHKMKRKKISHTQEQLNNIFLSYHFLLRCPVEFLPYSTRKRYIRRAITADILFYLSDIEDLMVSGRKVVRSWIQRTVGLLNVGDTLVSYLHNGVGFIT